MENQFPIFENIWLADDDPDDREIFEDAITQILPNVSPTMFSNANRFRKNSRYKTTYEALKKKMNEKE